MAIEYRKYMFTTLLLLVFAVFAQEAVALANQTGPGLPGETALNEFIRFILGPVGFTLAILALVAVGYAISRGGEMSTVISAGVYTLVGIGFILGARTVLMALFPGAVIGSEEAEFILRMIGVGQ